MILLLLAVSCGPDLQATDTSSAICTTPNVPSYEEWTQGFLMSKCQSCHASTTANRYGAPDQVIFDTYEQVERWRESIARTVLKEESMPPSGGVTDEERVLLDLWLQCPH